MSRFCLDVAGINDIEQELKYTEQILADLRGDIDRNLKVLYNQNERNISVRAEQLEKCSSDIGNICDKVIKMSTTLSAISDLTVQAEQNAVMKINNESVDEVKNSSPDGATDNDSFWEKVKNLLPTGIKFVTKQGLKVLKSVMEKSDDIAKKLSAFKWLTEADDALGGKGYLIDGIFSIATAYSKSIMDFESYYSDGSLEGDIPYLIGDHYANMFSEGLGLGINVAVSTGATALLSMVPGLNVAAPWIGTAVGAGASMLYNNFAKEWVNSGLKTLNHTIVDVAPQVMETVGDVIDKGTEFVGNTIEKTGEVVGNVIETTGEVVGNAVEKGAEFVGNTVETVGDFADNVLEKGAAFLDGGFSAILSW